jgi:fatty-acyl-CoA synthase
MRPSKEDLGLSVSLDQMTLGAFIREVGARYQHQEALIFGNERLTYGGLLDRVRACARALLAVGVGKGTKVALLLGNRPEFVVAAFGVAMAGGVVVPISTLAAAEERYHILQHSDASLLIAQERLSSHAYLEELAADHPGAMNAGPGCIADPTFPFLRRIVGVGAADLAAVQPWDRFLSGSRAVSDQLLDAVSSAIYPSDDALIVYTSGTTALPKAVLHTHRSVTIQLWRWAQQLGLTEADRVWSVFPLFWTAGFAFVLGGALASGAGVVMQETFDAGEALAALERERVTTIHCFDHTDAQLAAHPDAGRRDLSTLRHLRQKSALRKVANVPPSSWSVRAAYGLSETFTTATGLPVTAPLELREASHGAPLPGMEIRIVDAGGTSPVPVGATGEIAVRGITMMRGYYKSLPEDCFDDEGWFHTKDAGYLDPDGYLHWTGRMSGLIKTAGANVSPIEVENKVQELELLGTVAVVGVPHPTLGEVVVLCGVPRTGVEVREVDVIKGLRRSLASYKVPRRVLLFSHADFARTSNEKFRLDQIRELAGARIMATDEDEEWVAFLRDGLGDRARGRPR